MKYSIQMSKSVTKFLSKHEDIARVFYQKIKILHENIYTQQLDINALTGQKNHYRIRIGKYRFLYEINDKEILIYFYDADTRGDIYK